MPAKLCQFGGGQCPDDALPGGYCQAHTRRKFTRDKEVRKHYGSQHKRLRIMAFRRDEWRCTSCGWIPKCIRLHLEFMDQLSFPSEEQIMEELTALYHRGDNHLQADHIQDVETHPELAQNLENYRTLCRDCHALVTGGPQYR